MTFLIRDGVRLRVCHRGEGPEAIVLVHGWKQSHRVWDPLVARLAADHHVVAFDLRGMGESDKPGGRYDFDVLADDLAWLLGELELGRVSMIGWSMGCTVALRLLERGEPRIRRLMLVSGPLRLTTSSGYPFGMLPGEIDGLLGELERTWPVGERQLNCDYLIEAEPALVDWLTAIALQTPLDLAMHIVREQGQLDTRDVLTTLEIPVVAAYGRHDRHWPPELAEYIAELSGGEAHIFEESAHCAPIEEADRFAELVAALHRDELEVCRRITG